ncbi:antitermination regulator, partial [Streptomyces goshikiensis]
MRTISSHACATGSSPRTPREPPMSDGFPSERTDSTEVPGIPGGTGQPGDVSRLAATVERLRQEALDAQEAADGRALIELAKGILVGPPGVGPGPTTPPLAPKTR